MSRQRGPALWAKASVDKVCAAMLLIVTAPLTLATAMAIRIVMGPPALFRQRRPGRHGRPFTLLKFRTMRETVDDEGQALPDGQRLTKLGTWLRKTSVDELPQLLNVLAGHMSLVGPRPLLMEYLDRYSEDQARRHDVLPGITGWAQVNGRNAASWRRRFDLDLHYVRTWSLALDFKILFMTFFKAAAAADVTRPGHATTPYFLGNDEQGHPLEGTEEAP